MFGIAIYRVGVSALIFGNKVLPTLWAMVAQGLGTHCPTIGHLTVPCLL